MAIVPFTIDVCFKLWVCYVANRKVKSDIDITYHLSKLLSVGRVAGAVVK